MEGKRGKGIRIPEHIPEKLKTLLMQKDRLVILLLGGILLLVIALPVSEKGASDSGKQAGYTDADGKELGGGQSTQDYAAYLEEKLADTLSKVSGVGRVQVMVTLKSSAEKVVEKDVDSESESVQETDSQGGSRSTMNSTRSQTTVYSGDETGQTGEPYITKELTPVVEGVIVIAEGGDDAVAVQNITEAVQALFEIDTHKIKVMKSN